MKTKRKTKAQIRKENKEKKKRFYERHGIVFNKTIRKRDAKPNRQALDRGSALIYEGQTLIYENYKEPLKALTKTKGYGYYGTIAQTSDKKFIQCHICGNLFANLGGHLRVHKISGERYKEIHELGMGTALVSDERRVQMQERAVRKFVKGELPAHLVEYNKKVRTGEIKHIGVKHRNGGMHLERRNKLGLCPDQVLIPIKELAKKLGHTPSYDEFRAFYKGRYAGSIRYQHGSYLNAVKKAGLISAKEIKEPDNEKLLQELVEFHKKYGRIPMTSDFNRGLLRPRALYFRRFGNLNNARIEAGLNAVLPMPFGQIVELTPNEYIKYKEGKEVKAKRRLG